MKINQKQVYVYAPAGGVTGGPELLHQLVDVLVDYQKEAYISYYPESKSQEIPQPYKKYNCDVCVPIDSAQSFILVPETATWLLRKFKRARKGIWWQSVDNYFTAGNSRSLYRRWKKKVTQNKLNFNEMFDLTHFAQSYYAKDFLSQRNLSSIFLGDYLSKSHFASDAGVCKKDQIVYNPSKGLEKIQKLILKYPGYSFIPVKGLSSPAVAALLRSSKLYVDFGHHPGMDRLPREAAVAGCCVITGQHGSAGFSQDLPIPEKYKLNDFSEGYVDLFGDLVRDIFHDFESAQKDFDEYRIWIRKQEEGFRSQVRSIFVMS